MPVQGSLSIIFDMENEQKSPSDSLRIPEVLFVCVHNAGRSQMAAGLVTLRSEGHIRVRSAGSAPAEAVNPLVVGARAGGGVDPATAFPNPPTDDFGRAADGVIPRGGGDACPFSRGKR